MKKIIFSLSLLASGICFAKPYGDAGCGLGSVVFGNDNTPAMQVMAFTLNHTSGTQTFGLTSGTSNCADNGVALKEKEVPLFIEMNKDGLARDAARGQGETLSGLAELMGCDQNAFSKTVKKNYQPIFEKTKMNPVQIEKEIHQAVAQQKICKA